MGIIERRSRHRTESQEQLERRQADVARRL